LWSRWPLADARVLSAGHAFVVACVPELGVTVGAVHTLAPSRRWRERIWWRSFDTVETVAAATPGPLVVAGDWNATMAHGPLRRLVAGGRLRDAHVDAGRGSARTWPARLPVALLDRVLVSPEIAVESIREVRLPGSDHRAVVADLALTG
jgi:endonuclease/exonuclease/phosphatase family metal-dependent hydrolase